MRIMYLPSTYNIMNASQKSGNISANVYDEKALGGKYRRIEVFLTDSNKHVRLELGDFLRRLANEVMYLIVGDAQMLWFRHTDSLLDCGCKRQR